MGELKSRVDALPRAVGAQKVDFHAGIDREGDVPLSGAPLERHQLTQSTASLVSVQDHRMIGADRVAPGTL